MRERNRYLRGMTVWVGFTQTAVPYERDAALRRRRRSTRCAGCCASRSTRSPRSRTPRCSSRRSSASPSRLRLPGDPRRGRLPHRRRSTSQASRRGRSPCCCSAGIQLIAIGHHRRVRGPHLRRGQAAPAVPRPRAPQPRAARSRGRPGDARPDCGRRAVEGLRPRRGRRGPRLRAAASPSRATTCDVYERWPGLGGQAATLDVGGGTCSSATTTTGSRRTATSSSCADELGVAEDDRVAARPRSRSSSRAAHGRSRRRSTSCASRRCRCAAASASGLRC